MIKAEVDGEVIGLEFLDFLYQKKPSPGGHVYRMVFDKSSACGIGVFKKMANVAAIDSIDFIDLYWRIRKCRNSSDGACAIYLINSIESIRMEGDVFVVEGVCSRIGAKSP